MGKIVQNNDAKKSRTFEEAVSLVGFGKYNLFIILATGGAIMAVIVETMCSMYITPAAQCDLNLSLSDKGLLYAVSFLGVVVSSHFWGYLADTHGRRFVVLISLTTSALVSFVCSFVSNTALFIFLRFLNGFLISGASAITYAFAGEFHDSQFRPRVVSWMATFVAIGNMYMPSAAWALLPQEWSFQMPLIDIPFRPWRLLVIAYALPSLFFAALVYFMPESPKYLMVQGNHKEALKVLAKVFSINTGRSESEYPVTSIIWNDSRGTVHHEKNEGMLKSMWQQTVPLFKKPYVLKTLMVCYMEFALFMATSTVAMWYPQILTMMGSYGKVVSANDVTLCKSIAYDEDTVDTIDNTFKSRALVSSICRDNVDEDAFLVPVLIGVAYAIAYILIGTFINLCGPKKMLSGILVASTVAALCAQLISGYYYILITLSIFLMSATGIGVINALAVDLYPTQIRGMALAVALLFGRLGAMTGSNVGGPLMLDFCDYMFYILVAIQGLVILFGILIPSNKADSDDKDRGDS